MAADNDAALKAENEALKAQLHDSNIKDVTKAREKAEAEVVQLKQKVADADQRSGLAAEETRAAKQALEAAQAALKTANEELSLLKSEKVTAHRVKTVVKDLGQTEEAAGRLVATLAALSDEQFTAAMTAWVTNNPQGPGSSTSMPAPTAPKSTPAPLPPKSTGQPAPMAGKASATDLDGAVPAPDVALSVDADAAGEAVRLTIAKHFGFVPDAAQDN